MAFATLLSILLSIATSVPSRLPEGTRLHVRLMTAVGSYASKPGSSVTAVLIAPVTVDGEIVLQPGSMLTGRVKSVTRVGLGLRHEIASLDLDFDRIAPRGGQAMPMSAQVAEVDNGREHVTREGQIEGVRSTGSISYRVSGYIRAALRWEIHEELAEWAIRSILMEVPEPEIYYPAGSELTLALSEPLEITSPRDCEPAYGLQLSDDEATELSRVVSLMPYQTNAPISGRTSDLTNLMFIGSRDEIVDAFDAAGWTQPRPASFRDGIRWIRAVAELHGDDAGSMSLLLLKGAEPAMAWEKGLNDVSKRHHIRIWKAAGTWHGQDMWIGAATHDVDIRYMRRGKAVSHRIDAEIDEERDKVADDLAFSNCGNVLDWVDRPDFPRSAHNATGDPIVTDGRMAVIQLNSCSDPRRLNETFDVAKLPEHGGEMQRLLRREILSARNELLRTNPYWRTFEASRWLVTSIRDKERRKTSPPVLATDAPESTISKIAHASVFRMQ